MLHDSPNLNHTIKYSWMLKLFKSSQASYFYLSKFQRTSQLPIAVDGKRRKTLHIIVSTKTVFRRVRK